MKTFQFFSERAETRPQHKEQAIRSAYLTAGLACIALDGALEQILYEDIASRYHAIVNGVTYGDAGDAKVQNSVNTVLEALSSGMENGRVVSRQARDALDKLFKNVRSDIIAEYFSRENNASSPFSVAKELDDRAHSTDSAQVQVLSPEAKSVLGVFADFVQIKRNVLFRRDGLKGGNADPVTSNSTEAKARKSEGAPKDGSSGRSRKTHLGQGSLLVDVAIPRDPRISHQIP